MNSPVPSWLNDNALQFAADDLRQAQASLDLSLNHARAQGPGLSDDPYVIARFGDLSIRLELARALYHRAATSTDPAAERRVAVAEALIASAEALRAIDDTQHELTGSRAQRALQGGRQALRHEYRLIGEYRLNGVQPSLAQEPRHAS